MSIIPHIFNDQKINQAQTDLQFGKYQVPAGYVNLTEMCKVNSKQLAHYKTLKATNAYLEVISSETGIPVKNLIIAISTHWKEGTQGTWGHIDVAKLLAKWLSKAKNDHPEQFYRDKLQSEIGGEIEVSTITGDIDLLTKKEIIEIKRIKHWKAAMGQVLTYGTFYPKHTKRIHLFGKTQESYLDMIHSIADTYGIVVTWEE